MANLDTGEIRLWADLSDEERKSGRWVPLPDTDENGDPIQARLDRGAELRAMFPQDTFRTAIDAINDGEDRYRQNVLGQSALRGNTGL